jgi:UTP:GlnB (protein PII) uridylyltransferase
MVTPRVWRGARFRPHRPAVKTEVELVGGVGEEVVLDVFCEDHVGVLWIIAKTLVAHGLAIRLAKISTQGHRVADGFYVRDARTGEKVTDVKRLKTAARALREALEQIPAARAAV